MPLQTPEHRAQRAVTSRFVAEGGGGGFGRLSSWMCTPLLTEIPKADSSSCIEESMPDGK